MRGGGGKILRQGAYPLPYDLDFSYSLVCGYIWSCILLKITRLLDY